MDILNFEDIITLIILCAIPLFLIVSSVFNCKILPGIFICIILMLILVVISSEALLDNAVPTESRTEIQEIIEQKSTSQNSNRVTYKDLSGNTKEALVIDAKTSDDDISYSYIETKTYKYGFLYKDVNTLYLRR